jgi:hypothetical protein
MPPWLRSTSPSRCTDACRAANESHSGDRPDELAPEAVEEAGEDDTEDDAEDDGAADDDDDEDAGAEELLDDPVPEEHPPAASSMASTAGARSLRITPRSPTGRPWQIAPAG